MAKKKSGTTASRLARLAMVDPGRISLCLARSLHAPHAHCLLAGVPLLFLSLGHVCLPDRSAGQFQRHSPDSVRRLGHIDLFRRRVREFRVRLGLSVRFFAGFGSPSSHAQVYVALLDGIFPLCFADWAGIAVPFFWGEAHPLFFCRLCPAGALEGALPSMAQAAIAGNASYLAHGGKNDNPGPVFAGHVLYMASLVHAVLSLGGNLQPFRLGFPVFPEFS